MVDRKLEYPKKNPFKQANMAKTQQKNNQRTYDALAFAIQPGTPRAAAERTRMFCAVDFK